MEHPLRCSSLGHILGVGILACLLVSGVHAANPVPTVTGQFILKR